MTTTSADDNPMNSSDRDYDDLTEIKGIAGERQNILRGNKFNVVFYEDLVKLDPAKVASQISGVKPEMVKQWQAEAQELAAIKRARQGALESDVADGGKKANSSTQMGKKSKPTIEFGDKEQGEKVDPAAGNANGGYIRMFLVMFKVLTEDQKKKRVIEVVPWKVTKDGHYENSGEPPKILDKGEELYPWMLEQLGKVWHETEEEPLAKLPAAGEPMREPQQSEPRVTEALTPQSSPADTPLTEPLVTEAAPLKVVVTQIRVFQPPEAETPIGIGQAGRPFPGLIRGNAPFSLEVSFGFTGKESPDLAEKQASYRALFYSRSIPTGKKLHLGDTQPKTVGEDRPPFTAKLAKTEATLLPGMYRLGALVMFQNVTIGPDYLEIPVLQVV